MYRKSMIAGLLLMSIAATAQTEKKNDTKRSDNLRIEIDGNKVIINGKDVSKMTPEERKELENGSFAFPKGALRIFGDGDWEKGFNFNFNDNVSRAFLGVLSEPHDKGARVTSITKESAAEKAGLQKDDIITKVNDKTIGNSDDLYDAITAYSPDDKVTITYLRNGKEAKVSATLGKSNDGTNFMRNFNLDLGKLKGLNNLREWSLPGFGKPRLGLEIQDLESGKGVKVLDVDEDSPAEKAGLKKDDIIERLNDKEVTSVDGLRKLVQDIKEGDAIKAKINRSGKQQEVEIKFPKKLKTANL